MGSQEVSWSVFLRQPTSVEPLLERGEVILRRRDGVPLRLSRASQAESTDGLRTALRLLRNAVVHNKRSVFNAPEIAELLPWTRFLPERDRMAFVAEFLQMVESCADLGDFAALEATLADWKATAALHAEGRAKQLKRPIRKIGAKVGRP